MGNDNNNTEIYSQFYDKLYYKGLLCSTNRSTFSSSFDYPIISSKPINKVKNIVFFHEDSSVEAIISSNPVYYQWTKINEGLYLNYIAISIDINNVGEIDINHISLDANGSTCNFNVEIKLQTIYVNYDSNLEPSFGMLESYSDYFCTLIYCYNSFYNRVRLDYVESMVEGIEIKQIYLANCGNGNDTIDISLWIFDKIENNYTNLKAYKNR